MDVNGTKHWEHQHLINYVEPVWLIAFNLLVVLLEWPGGYWVTTGSLFFLTSLVNQKPFLGCSVSCCLSTLFNPS